MLRDPNLIPLSHEHQHALALCVRIERGLDAEGSCVQIHAEAIIDQFDREMSDHFESEEQILFPVMAGISSVAGLVTELLAEHSRMTSLVDAIRSKPTKELVLEFSRILRLHVRKEENVLFEEAPRLLSHEQLNRVGEQLRSR